MFRNKLLTYSFGVSFVLNAIFLMLVGKSNLFQHADSIPNLRAREIIVYKPPMAEKPRPAPKITQIPPKRTPAPARPTQPNTQPAIAQPPQPARPTPSQIQKPQPESPAPRPAIFVKPPPPRPNSRPDPFVPLAPRRSAPAAAAHPALKMGSHSSQGAVAVPPSVAHVVSPEPSPAPAPEVTPAPPPQPQPKPVPVEEPKPRPRPSLPDRAVPEPDGGDWPTLQLPNDVDASSITSNEVVISFEVDTSGRPRRLHIKVSCGNSEVDNEAYDAVKQMRFKPAVQNGEAEEMEDEHIFHITLN